MSIVKVQGNASGTGIFTVASPNSNTDRTLTLPDNTGTLVSTGSTAGVSQAMLASGVAGNGPAFSAYASSNQSITSYTTTKVQTNIAIFDTASCYNTSNYRFTPNVAGYYDVGMIYNSSATMTGALVLNIIVNGGATYQLGRWYFSSDYPSSCGSILLYLNGTTDYVESFVMTTGNSTSQSGLQFSRFYASLARAA